MTVQHILDQKGKSVVTISPDSTIAQAAAMLAAARIGAVVVSRDGKHLAGILSERDIIRALARKGADALGASVSDYATREVVTCNRETGVDELMEIMTTGKFRHVPIVEGGELIGIVSIGDVVKRRLAEIEAESQALKEYITAG